MSRGIPLSGVAISSCRTACAASTRASSFETSAAFAALTQARLIPMSETAVNLFMRILDFRFEEALCVLPLLETLDATLRTPIVLQCSFLYGAASTASRDRTRDTPGRHRGPLVARSVPLGS